MHELQIPNGYFQLWHMYLAEREITLNELEFLAPYQQQLEQILQLKIDSQSPGSFFAMVMELTRQHLDCPQLVFEMAKFIRPEHFGVLGYMATRSNSVAEALHYIVRFSRLVIDGAEASPLRMYHDDKVMALTWPLINEKYALMNELTSACMAHLAKQIFPASLHMLQMQFGHAPQMAKYHYEKFFGCQVSFSHQQYSFEFSSESLDLKSELADPSLMQLLLKQAEDAIASKPLVENLVHQLQVRMADYLRVNARPPKIEQLADELHMSVRTLQRHLSELQCSFKKVLEEERMKRCEILLQQKMALTDIAEQLGYSDQSALARAYKASTGQTLLQRRKILKAEP